MSQGILGYQDFLAARDGEADLARHTLSRREAVFAGLARRPVRSAVPIRRAVMRALYRTFGVKLMARLAFAAAPI